MATAFFLGRHKDKIIKTEPPHSYCCEKCCVVVMDTKLECDCGEDNKIFDWHWSNQSGVNNTMISNNGRDVLFHPIYSTGNAAIKGTKRLKINHHYYWEIKILTNLYGTDVMIGVGTSKVDFNIFKTKFCSMLGYDEESWGYSFHGRIKHSGCTRIYGGKYGLGSIIGVHVDMCSGTLEYYINRKPMGIAFTGLKHKELYPIVSSTAAQSSIKLICSIILKPSLQMQILKMINRDEDLMKMYKTVPGLSKLFQRGYFWLLPQPKQEKNNAVSTLDLEDEVVLSNPTNHKRLYVSTNKLEHSNTLENPSKRRITSYNHQPNTMDLHKQAIILQLIDNIECLREDITLENQNRTDETDHDKCDDGPRLPTNTNEPESSGSCGFPAAISKPSTAALNLNGSSTSNCDTNSEFFQAGLRNDVFISQHLEDDMLSNFADFDIII